MDDIIQEVEDHFTFRLVVDFRKLNKRVIPDPYPIPRAKELNRIAKKKVYKTSLDLKYGFGAMEFYRDHSKFMAVINPFGIFIPTRLGFGGSNGPAYMQRLSDYVYGVLEDVCDTGPGSVGEMVAWITEAENILRRTSAPYHPQSMGLVERANQTIQAILSKLSFTRRHWDLSLSFAHYSCNVYASNNVSRLVFFRDYLWIPSGRQSF